MASTKVKFFSFSTSPYLYGLVNVTRCYVVYELDNDTAFMHLCACVQLFRSICARAKQKVECKGKTLAKNRYKFH